MWLSYLNKKNKIRQLSNEEKTIENIFPVKFDKFVCFVQIWLLHFVRCTVQSLYYTYRYILARKTLHWTFFYL